VLKGKGDKLNLFVQCIAYSYLILFGGEELKIIFAMTKWRWHSFLLSKEFDNLMCLAREEDGRNRWDGIGNQGWMMMLVK
jgi:hypothetical protein